MHLGLTPWDFSDASAAGLIAQAQFAEACGYASFWLPENHFNRSAIPDPLMLLAAVAGATSKIRLATTSYLLPLRHPLQAAEQVAVLDQLSGGRVILGVGRGFAPDMLKAFNVRPQDKRALFETCLVTMMLAWSGQPVEIDSLNRVSVVLDPLPVQRPAPPIWVAAFGPKALAQAGRLGLPYLASPMETIDSLHENFARHSEAACDANQPIPEYRPIMRTIYVSDNRHELRHLRQRLSEASMQSQRRDGGAQVDDWTIIGDSVAVKEKIDEYESRLGVTHLVAARLRVSGMSQAALKSSVAKVAELVN